MSDFRRMVLLIASLGAAVLGVSCSGGVPAEPGPSGEDSVTASASPFSDTDSPQPSPRGSHLLGRVVNEGGAPVAGCLIRIEGDSKEYAIVSGAEGEFDMAIPSGSQILIIACDSELYAETSVTVEVPKNKEFAQDFTVQAR
jgi:lipoprotein